MATNQSGYEGQQNLDSGSSEYSTQQFVIQQMLNRVATVTLVKVVKCTNSSDLSPVGYVDLQPLVNQLDGVGNTMAHGMLHNIPYSRLQGGANAIIIDPQVGDIGLCGFCSRDISAVKASKAIANPGSLRKFDMADGVYIGGVLNGVPTQYVQFSPAGIKIHSPVAVILDAPDVQISAATVEIVATTSTTITTPTFTVNGATVINGPLNQGTGTAGGTASLQGPLTVVNDVIAGGKSLDSHTHLEHGAGNQTAPPT